MRISEFEGYIVGWKYDSRKGFRFMIDSACQAEGATIEIPYSVNKAKKCKLDKYANKKVRITVELLEDDERPSV